MNKIDFLAVLPNDEEYTLQEVVCDMNAIKTLLGGDVAFVKVSETLGFYCNPTSEQVKRNFNFAVMRNGEVLHDIYGPVYFSRIFNDEVPTGISPEDSVELVSNLVEASWGRVLFLDNLEQLN